jgi:hypothetical protein
MKLRTNPPIKGKNEPTKEEEKNTHSHTVYIYILDEETRKEIKASST